MRTTASGIEPFAPPPSGRIPGLDGVRAFSILLVIIAHEGTAYVRAAALPNQTLWWVRGLGSLGVGIFFGLSGFLITTLLVTELDRTGRVTLSGFYFRRVFRIFPAYFVFLLASFAVAPHVPGRDFAASFLFVSDYVPIKSWWLGHTWSLSVEEQFYLFWPLTVYLLHRARATRFAVFLIVATPFLRVGSYLLFPSWKEQIGLMLHARVDALMAGCLLALLWDTREHPFVRLLSHGRTAAVGVLFLFVISPILQHSLKGAYKHSVGSSMEAFAVCSVIAWIIRNPKHAAGRLLNSRPVAHFGVLSYSLYLWQQPFFGSDMDGVGGLAFPIRVAGALFCAEASHWLVEKPFLRFRSRLERRRQQVDPVPGVAIE